jgi:hypothetical protein
MNDTQSSLSTSSINSRKISVSLQEVENGFVLNYQDKNWMNVTHVASTKEAAIEIIKNLLTN